MDLLEEFNKFPKNLPEEPAKRILFASFYDLIGRSGFDHLWDTVRPETKEDILRKQLAVIENQLHL